MVLAFRGVAAARVLVHRDIAMSDELLAPTQDRPAHRLGGAWQPSVGAVGLVPGIGCGNAVGCPVQDDRPAWPAALRQKHEGVEPGAVEHRHHDLKTAGVGHLQTTIRCVSGALQSASSRSAARKENELNSFDLIQLNRWSGRLSSRNGASADKLYCLMLQRSGPPEKSGNGLFWKITALSPSITRGTEGSNPPSSSSESCAN